MSLLYGVVLRLALSCRARRAPAPHCELFLHWQSHCRLMLYLSSNGTSRVRALFSCAGVVQHSLTHLLRMIECCCTVLHCSVSCCSASKCRKQQGSKRLLTDFPVFVGLHSSIFKLRIGCEKDWTIKSNFRSADSIQRWRAWVCQRQRGKRSYATVIMRGCRKDNCNLFCD